MLGRLMVLVLVGVGLGTVLAMAAGPALSAVIYTTSPRDPVVLLGVLIALLVAAALSSWRPVRRGLRVNPVSALRCE